MNVNLVQLRCFNTLSADETKSCFWWNSQSIRESGPPHTHFENTVKDHNKGTEMCSGTTEEETTSPSWLGTGDRKFSQKWPLSQLSKEQEYFVRELGKKVHSTVWMKTWSLEGVLLHREKLDVDSQGQIHLFNTQNNIAEYFSVPSNVLGGIWRVLIAKANNCGFIL